MISSNVVNLHYSDDENMNSDERQDSNQSLRLLSSISPSKKRLSKASPDKLNHISPKKRIPLENKSNNRFASKTTKQQIINSRDIQDSNAKRKLLRKSITVTKTGSFAKTNNIKKPDNGLIRYKSLVLDEFNDDDVVVDDFWKRAKERSSTLGIEQELDEPLDAESKSVQKMMNSKDISLYDDPEFVPSKPDKPIVYVDEPHTEFTKEDKRKLNEFNAPFSDVHTDRTKMMQEFMLMNEKYKNKENIDEPESITKINPYEPEKVNFDLLDAYEYSPRDSACSPSSEHANDAITEADFDRILEENGYASNMLELDF